MGDLTASVTAVFSADVSGLRKEWDAFRKEVESRPLRVPLEADRGTASSAGPASVTGTFGSTGNGIASVGPTAGQRMDAMNIARNTGASLAMQNGSPGALPGGTGITSPGPPDIAERWERATAYARKNIKTGGIGGILPEFPQGPPRHPADITGYSSALGTIYSSVGYVPQGAFHGVNHPQRSTVPPGVNATPDAPQPQPANPAVPPPNPAMQLLRGAVTAYGISQASRRCRRLW